jgi:glycine cleavage system aminomethyltransferase T
MGDDSHEADTLCDWHKQHGANMVDFGDYLMPVVRERRTTHGVI